MAQEAAKAGRTLSSEERANLPATPSSTVRDRDSRASERSAGLQYRGHGSGRGQAPRGGGGRGR